MSEAAKAQDDVVNLPNSNSDSLMADEGVVEETEEEVSQQGEKDTQPGGSRKR